MEELFLNLRFSIKLTEALACITGFVFWKRLSPRCWKSFPVYLLVITLCEFAGWYMNNNGMSRQGKYMYSYFVVPLEFFFLFYMYLNMLPKVFRKTVFMLAGIFLLAFIAEYMLLLNTKWVWRSLTYVTGIVSVLILSIIYLLSLISRERVIQYKKEPFFWVNLGVLLFYVGSFPYFATLNYMYKANISLFWVLAFAMVVLNSMMYLFFTAGFICFRNRRSY